MTSLGGQRPGLAMGLNVFTLFLGFGLGSLLFGRSFTAALGVFAKVEFVLALLSVRLFLSEVPASLTARGG